MTTVADAPSSIPARVATPETLDELEFHRALDLVGARAVSPLGADAVRQRVPTANSAAVHDALAAVGELQRHLKDEGRFLPLPVSDIRETLGVLRADGGVLEAEQLLVLGSVITAIRENAALLSEIRAEAPRVAALYVEPPPQRLATRIAVSIAPDGSVRDGASPQLAAARRRVRDTREQLVGMLRRVAERLGARRSDSGVTLREGRYVIAVPREMKSRVKGLVHAESGSGATLFVEPNEAVEVANGLRAAEAKEVRAVLAVLRTLTDELREYFPALDEGWRMSVQLDDLYARAQYAVAVDASVPQVADDIGVVRIRKGFHPLLREQEGAVPFDLDLDRGGTLVISGPNAGGKTVLLKAVGLTAALSQAGVVPPVGFGTELPLFKRIHSDIGDRQSIAESLSTFSAHLAALKMIVGEADERSLVLMDELGGGTDPVEGGALAGGLLHALSKRGATSLATTHLHQLKELAAKTDGMLNASLEFDTESLTPTYRLRVGKPGRSYGLAIARRLGMPEDVVTRAEQLVPKEARTLDATLAQLERRESSLADAESELEELRADLEAEQVRLRDARGEVMTREASLEERERGLERRGRESARRFLLESRRRVEDALTLARAAVDEATVKEARRLVEEGVREEVDAMKRLDGLASKGWRVIVGTGNRDSGQAETGKVAHSAQRTVRANDGGWPETTSTAHAASEISLRGMRVEEAQAALLSAVDAAIVADLPQLRVIHGKGTGVLRQVVADALQGDARVRRFHIAPPERGGAGVTVVEFD